MGDEDGGGAPNEKVGEGSGLVGWAGCVAQQSAQHILMLTAHILTAYQSTNLCDRNPRNFSSLTP